MQQKLVYFVKFLEDHDMIDTSLVREDSSDGFINRLKLQKYVFLAKSNFNLDLGYEFNQYRYGPYSPRLTNDYFALNMEEVAQDHQYTWRFDKDAFLSVLSDKDETWLEVASTLIDIRTYYQTRNSLIDTVARIKPRYARSDIEKVLNDLVSDGLIKDYP